MKEQIKIKKEQNMSVPIQTTSLDELAAGQRPLTPPAGDRRGNEHNQVFPLTGRPGVQVNNDQPARPIAPNNANGAASRPSASVSGLNAGSGLGVAVKPVDRRTIEGSTPGDSRCKPGDTAAASVQRAANGAGVRGAVGQFPNGKRDATLGSFSKDHANQSYPTPDAGD